MMLFEGGICPELNTCQMLMQIKITMLCIADIVASQAQV